MRMGWLALALVLASEIQGAEPGVRSPGGIRTVFAIRRDNNGVVEVLPPPQSSGPAQPSTGGLHATLPTPEPPVVISVPVPSPVAQPAPGPTATPVMGVVTCGGSCADCGTCGGDCRERFRQWLCHRPVCKGCCGGCPGPIPQLYLYFLDRPCVDAPIPCCPPCEEKCCGGCALSNLGARVRGMFNRCDRCTDMPVGRMFGR